jgi:hypothetical protein
LWGYFFAPEKLDSGAPDRRQKHAGMTGRGFWAGMTGAGFIVSIDQCQALILLWQDFLAWVGHFQH